MALADDVAAELASRNGGAPPAPDAASVAAAGNPASVSDMAAAELARRSSDATAQPGGAIGDLPQTAPAAPVNPGAGLGLSLTDALAAASQGTSPIVRDASGKLNYEMAPPDEQAFYGEKGYPRDQQAHVALRDPADDAMKVFLRSPEMAEGPMTTIGRILGFGTLAGPLSVASRTIPAATGAKNLIQDFDRIGVAPSLPAVAQSAPLSLATNAAANVPIVSAPLAEGAKRMVSQLSSAADNVASGYGAARTPFEAGKQVQQGLTDFAKGGDASGMSASDIIAQPTRASSVADKSAALYDRVAQLVPANTPVPLTQTVEAMQGPASRFPSAPGLAQQITNPKLAQLAKTLKGPATLTMPEAQELRSYIGRQLGDASLVSDIPRSDLKQVYGALSGDIGAAVDATGNPAAQKAFTNANSYYKAAMDRVDQVESLLSKSPEGAIASINAAAGKGAGADLGKLTALQRSLPAREWGNVASAVIRRLGEPAAGAADPLSTNFSAGTFTTNWSKLSPQARDVLFGNGPQRDALESLARVASAQKNVDKFRNTSNTASQGATMALMGAAWADPISTTLGLLGGRIASTAMMNPGFTRWLTSLPVGKVSAGASAGAAAFLPKLAQLDSLARISPDLAPVAQRLRLALASSAENPQ
jgi:hypothetical protein